MSYFAVVRSQNGKQFKVLHCHLNIWMLPAVPKTKIFLDVGLHIRSEEADLQSFSVALPFVADELCDLAPTLSDPTTSQLIFRQPSREGRVYFRGGEGVPIAGLNLGECKKAKTDDPQRSLWELESSDALMKDSDHYFRFRFTVRDCARTWNAKRHLVLAYGGFLDFRISDTREVKGYANWDGVRERIIPIDALHLFLIAAPTFQLRETSPKVYSTRIMEPNAWETYLRRKTLGRRMVIYGWQYLSDGKGDETSSPPIDDRAPFRIFADFSRDVISLQAQLAVQNVIAVLAFAAVIAVAAGLLLPYLPIKALEAKLSQYGLATIVIAAVLWFVRNVSLIRAIRNSLNRLLERLDNFFYETK